MSDYLEQKKQTLIKDCCQIGFMVSLLYNYGKEGSISELWTLKDWEIVAWYFFLSLATLTCISAYIITLF